MTLTKMQAMLGVATPKMSALQLTTEHREAILRSVIRRATPRWWQWPFSWFSICPLDSAATLFNIDWSGRNSAYLLLQHYHCVDYWDIPREIRRRIPDLIREALSSRTRIVCEIEEAGDAGASASSPAMVKPQ